MRSNREYDYFGNVLEYDYFALYSSTSTITQKVVVLEYEYKYMSTITPSLDWIVVCFFGDLYCTELHIKVNFEYRIKIWYRLVSKNSGVESAIYQSVLKNSGIETALFLLHTVLLLGTVFYVNIRLTT